MNVSDVTMTMRVTAMNAAKAMSCMVVLSRIVMLEVKRKLLLVSTRHDGRGSLGRAIRALTGGGLSLLEPGELSGLDVIELNQRCVVQYVSLIRSALTYNGSLSPTLSNNPPLLRLTGSSSWRSFP